MAGWFALCPQYGDPACPNTSADPLAVLTAFRTAPPFLMNVFLIINPIVPYLYPVSYIALGLLAMKRAPWLATIGIVGGFVGAIPWGTIADQMYMLNTMAHLGQSSNSIPLMNSYLSVNPVVYIVAGGWIFGHLLGYVFLGIALARARAIPQWAAWLIVASAPIMGPIAYGTRIGWIQVFGYLMAFIGSIPAAITFLKQSFA